MLRNRKGWRRIWWSSRPVTVLRISGLLERFSVAGHASGSGSTAEGLQLIEEGIRGIPGDWIEGVDAAFFGAKA